MKEIVESLINSKIKDLGIYVSDAFKEKVEGKTVFNIELDSEEVIDLDKITEASRIINEIMDEAREIEQDYDIFTVDGTDYLILTIDEVNDRAYDYLKDTIEDTLRYEVPEYLRKYFNKEDYINDNLEDPFDYLFYNGSYKTIEDEDGAVYYFGEY